MGDSQRPSYSRIIPQFVAFTFLEEFGQSQQLLLARRCFIPSIVQPYQAPSSIEHP